MKNPFELVREIEFNSLDKKTENFNNSILNVEKFILWIVSFSVGGIALIIGNIDKLKINFDECDLKKSLVFLVSSLLLGILNRYLIHHFQVYSQITDNFIRQQLTNYDFPELSPDDISDENDFQKVIDRFKLDFDLDYSHYINEYENFDIYKKSIAIAELKERHNEITKFLQKSFHQAHENIRDTYKIAYGFSEKKSKKYYYMPQNQVSKRFNTLKYFVDLTFALCSISFIIAIILLIIKF